MISKKFQTLAFGATLALTTAFTSPAMASGDTAVCLPADKAKIVISKDDGVKIADFTNSSAGCLQKYAAGMSNTQLLLVADGDYQAWRDVNIDVAKRLRTEGIPTNVFFTGETDGDSTTAMTVAWGNGVKREVAPISIGGGHSINELAAAPDKAANFIHEVGTSVWNKYLKKAPYLALNQ